MQEHRREDREVDREANGWWYVNATREFERDGSVFEDKRLELPWRLGEQEKLVEEHEDVRCDQHRVDDWKTLPAAVVVTNREHCVSAFRPRITRWSRRMLWRDQHRRPVHSPWRVSSSACSARRRRN